MIPGNLIQASTELFGNRHIAEDLAQLSFVRPYRRWTIISDESVDLSAADSPGRHHASGMPRKRLHPPRV